MKVTVDRFEGDTAVVEISEHEYVTMARKLIPDAKEGDVIDISVDRDETEARSRHINALQSSLFED